MPKMLGMLLYLFPILQWSISSAVSLFFSRIIRLHDTSIKENYLKAHSLHFIKTQTLHILTFFMLAFWSGKVKYCSLANCRNVKRLEVPPYNWSPQALEIGWGKVKVRVKLVKSTRSNFYS